MRDAFAAPYATPGRRGAVADFVADIPLEDEHPSMPALTAIAEGLRHLDVPVLLAWGPADPVFSDRYLRDLIDRIPHADVHRYEGASHLVTEDAPALFDDLREWVEQLGIPTPVPSSTAPKILRRGMGAALSERAADPRSADDVAVCELGGGGRSITWRQLGGVVDALAAGLSDLGVERGDRVALLVPPGADLTAAVYACWRIGAVIVVADAGLGARGLARALRGAWPKHLIAIDRGLVAARALRIGGQRIAAGPVSPTRARVLGARTTLAALAESRPGHAHCQRHQVRRTRQRCFSPPVPPALPRVSCTSTDRSRPTATRCSRSTPSPRATDWWQPSRRSRCTARRWASPPPSPTWT